MAYEYESLSATQERTWVDDVERLGNTVQGLIGTIFQIKDKNKPLEDEDVVTDGSGSGSGSGSGYGGNGSGSGSSSVGKILLFSTLGL